MPRQGKSTDELRERGVRMALERESGEGSQWEAISSVAEKPGRKAETALRWSRADSTRQRPKARTVR